MRHFIKAAFIYLVVFSTAWCIAQTEHVCNVSTSRVRRISDFERAALRKVTPEYPLEAKNKGISGTVQLRLLVGKSGDVKAACPIYPDREPKPDSNLVVATQKAALKWKFPRNFGLRGELHLKFDYVEFTITFKFAPLSPEETAANRNAAVEKNPPKTYSALVHE